MEMGHKEGGVLMRGLVTNKDVGRSVTKDFDAKNSKVGSAGARLGCSSYCIFEWRRKPTPPP